MLVIPIMRHGVLQRLIGRESMSQEKGNGGIVDRDVHAQKSQVEKVSIYN
jgi:hypothetical protein